jgi:hypothetical protein
VLREAERRFEARFDLEGESALVPCLMGKSCLISSVASHLNGPGRHGIPLPADAANGAFAL